MPLNINKETKTDRILALDNISKEYPGVKALNQVSAEFAAGEVHALVGENGAGKSTMIKVISGAIEPTAGSIWYQQKEYQKMLPSEAKKIGIEVVYQEFNLAPSLSITENIFLGHSIKKRGMPDKKEMRRQAERILKDLGLDVDPETRIRDLTVAYMQLVEIAKAVSREAKVIIMDEPTATLTDKEVEILFGLIRRLKKAGTLVIYVSHRMDEIFEICDRVTVMRDGEKIVTKAIKDTSRAELIQLMVGRELKESFPLRQTLPGEVILKADRLSGNGVSGISFELRAGEILGFAGLVGAGRTETAELIFGASKKDGGTLYIEEQECRIGSPRDGIRHGIGLIPEDRKQQGVVLEKGVDWNISLTMLNRISRMNILNRKQEKDLAKRFSGDLNVKTPTLKQKVKLLSGGNQQKVVLAKWLATDSRILIFDEPTRGIDVGAKQEIYKLMNELAAKGVAIIMISSEMEELLGMSDRLLVFAEGRITGQLAKEEFSQAKVLEFASGNH